MTDIEVIHTDPDLLGEGPVWSAREQCLYWVDIKAPALRRLDPACAQVRSWSVSAEVGSMALRRQGGAVLALRTGFHFFDFETGTQTAIVDPEPDAKTNRFNDGKCDRAGRFWAGTLEDSEREPLGSLYRLDAERRCEQVLRGVICSNGIGWSPDDSQMYYVDTWTRRIDAFDFDIATGEVRKRRVFATCPPHGGVPDGLTVDADGFLWCAMWDGWRVVRYSPDGSVDRVVPMPVPRPTSCAFGGSDLTQLFVTSARLGLSAAEQARAPLSGSLFRIDIGTKGLPEPEFAG